MISVLGAKQKKYWFLAKKKNKMLFLDLGCIFLWFFSFQNNDIKKALFLSEKT
jgi:hypothetical protein